MEIAMLASRMTLFVALILILGSTSSGFADNDMDIADYSIRQALDSDEAREKLDPDIRLSFGHRLHGPVARYIGKWKSSKTSSLADGPEPACQHAFITALISLQRRAIKEGGNAVIGINSYYDRRETSSTAAYACGLGERRSAVALTGTVVRTGR
jgi:hypothetical protein